MNSLFRYHDKVQGKKIKMREKKNLNITLNNVQNE